MDGGPEGLHSRSGVRARRGVGVALAAVATSVALASMALLAPPPSAPTWTFPAIAGAAPSDGSAGLALAQQATPSGTDGTWTAASLPPFAPLATLTAGTADAAGVALDTTFVLASAGAVPAATLASGLEVSPLIELARTTNLDGSVTLRPPAPLSAGVTYRFSAHAPDGSLAGSWAFRAAEPLGVASTIPGDRATDVPLDTGIEITFNQDGILDAVSHATIQPAVAGRFEQHGRTLVFIPTRPLAPSTYYALTVTAGVALAGSSRTLERDVHLAFETQAAETSASVAHRSFQRALVETPTGEAPVIAAQVDWRATESAAMRPFTLDVFRFPDAEAAAAAGASLALAPTWSSWSTVGQVATGGLTRVLRASVAPTRTSPYDAHSQVIRLPAPLPVGWYLVDEVASAGRHAQAVLQVTDVATFAGFSATDAFFWVNDTAARSGSGAIAGATISVLGSATPEEGWRPGRRAVIGSTGTDGVLRAAVPAEVRAAAETTWNPGPLSILLVTAPDGRRALVPVGLPELGEFWQGEAAGPPRTNRWWSAFTVDRTTFRATDTINASGFLRSRDSRAAASAVTLRLVAGSPWETNERDLPPVVRAEVHPDAIGAFVAALAIRDLPLGPYTLELAAGDEVVERTWIQVDVIRKPAYQLSVETDRRAYLAGESIGVTVRATFFDGTPVPGVALRVTGSGEAMSVTTGADGTARTALAAQADACCQVTTTEIDASPANPEEGEISGRAVAAVYSAERWMEVDATTEVTAVDANEKPTRARAHVAGVVSYLDLPRLARGWSETDPGAVKPAGDPVPGGSVRVSLVGNLQVLRDTVVTYDFIDKTVIRTPVYDTHEEVVWSGSVRTDRTGRFALDLPIDPAISYQVRLETSDGRGRVDRTTTWAWSGWGERDSAVRRPWFGRDPSCVDENRACTYAVGAPVSLSLVDGRGDLPSGGRDRYLFATLQNGLRAVTTSASPTFRSSFGAADVPNLELLGVRFTGATYLVAWPSQVTFDSSTRAIKVALTPDRSGYEPGDTVRLSIRTTLPPDTSSGTGRPVAASVAVRIIDEKLYASGQAFAADPLDLLYAQVPGGLVRTYASHPLPAGLTGGGQGDVTGGGGRGDFRDYLPSSLCSTDANGLATLEVRLPDDLTSWHVSASAFTADLRAGLGSLLVPVGLPFFVEAPLAAEYLAGDRPVLRLRAYGSGLAAGDPVTFTVSSETLPMAATSVRGTAFEAVTVALPALKVGAQILRVAASGTHAGSPDPLADAVIRSFSVVPTRFTTERTAYAPLVTGPAPALPGSEGAMATYVFADAGRARYLDLLSALAARTSGRIDRAAAAALARATLSTTFGLGDDALPPASFDPGRYARDNLLALLPYASTDLAVTARMALLAPELFDASALRFGLLAQSATRLTREQRSLVLAGLAGLGEPVDAGIRAALADDATTGLAATDLAPGVDATPLGRGLTVRERLFLAAGAAALGDTALAAAIERDLVDSAGETLGGMLRLRVGATADDALEATALLAVVAAGIGDTAVALPALTYLVAQPGTDVLVSLEEAVAAHALVQRTPSSPARFALTVDGTRRVVELTAGGAEVLRLTPGQRATLRFEPLSGDVGVAASWRAAATPSALTTDPSLSLVRTRTTSGPAASDAVVEVRLTATFGPQALVGSYEVTELVPSGLVPLTLTQAWQAESGGGSGANSALLPSLVEGQRVLFTPWREARTTTVSMRYLARVVTPGVYAWEPAVLEAAAAPESRALTGTETLAIR